MSGTSRPPGFAASPPARARKRPEPAATDRLPSDTMTRRAIARSSTSPQLAAGIRRVTGEVMHHGVARRDLALRIPDRDIGVGTDLNRALARTQIVDFCRRCSGQLQACNERVAAPALCAGFRLQDQHWRADPSPVPASPRPLPRSFRPPDLAAADARNRHCNRADSSQHWSSAAARTRALAHEADTRAGAGGAAQRLFRQSLLVPFADRIGGRRRPA
jgi:hypothetical protein